MAQFLEQRLGLLQVRRIKPLSEPAIDLRQHLLGFFCLALLLPQPAQAHDGPQLQRFRLLPVGNLDRFEKIFFCFLLDARR